MGNGRRRPRWAAVLVAFVAALAIAGCGGDGGDEASGDTTETSETTDPTAAETTTTTLSPEAEVEAAHDAYYAMLVRLVQAPDPHDPELTERATGAALETFVSSMEEDSALGRVTRVGPNTGRTVLHTEVSGDHATVEVCSVDDGVHTEVATGRVLDDDVVTRRIVHRLERINGVWLVAEATSTASWEGVTDCA